MLCQYGCGKEALFYLKSVKKWCCCQQFNSCEKTREKFSKSGKGTIKTPTILINFDSSKMCFYNCGETAKFLIGKNQTPCCSDNRMKCKEERRKNIERQLGNIPWNKGLTKEDSRVNINTKNANKARNQLIKDGKLIIWNKGLTIEDPRVNQYTKKMKLKQIKGKPNFKLRKSISKVGESYRSFIQLFRRRLYIEWVFPILVRDDFKCTICGSNKKLEVHHQKEYRFLYQKAIKELNFNTTNWKKWTEEDILKLEKKMLEYHQIQDGKTVCDLCHSILDPYRKNTLKKSRKELLIEHERKYFGCK